MRIFATAAPGDLGNPMRRICLQHITAKVQILRRCFPTFQLENTGFQKVS